MSTKQLFNDEWSFSKQPLGQTLKEIHSDSIHWELIDLPHDWLIYNVNDLYETGEGWYKRILNKSSLLPDQCYSLRFEGVYMNSTLYINDKMVGQWKYGYSTFEFDITDYLTKEENEILVHVIHEAPNSRWYSGAGIYRNVWLKSYPNVHIVPDGIYITPTKGSDHWNVVIHTELSNQSETSEADYLLRQSIYELNKGEQPMLVATKETPITYDRVSNVFTQELCVSKPKLWDLDSPNLYLLKTELILDGNIIESESTQFGFRTIEFTTDHGFFLNGNHVKINGSCEHHDLGCLGAAMNKTALERELLILKSMGVNAIRTSHNMPAVELMELADELGLLINSEGFDMWERPKTTYDYARFFDQWVDKDVESWIRRDRNHPCVILWSIGNEIYDTHVDEHGQEITLRLTKLVHKYDYLHHAPVTIGSNYMSWEGAQKCADLIKVAGYNYAENLYAKHHAKYPDWMIYGSETASTVQSRGIYHFPYAQSVLSDEDEQCSSLGNSTTGWGARNTEYCITKDRDAQFSAGQFIWTGFDYIGEPTPYSTKNSYFGQIDTAGFPKDSFFIYQAEWTDYKKAPMVHIFPYWDFNEGQLVDVRVCSNAPKIELFFNDISQGSYEIDHKNGLKLTGNFVIPYQKGILRAVAYDELNQIIATDVQSSFEDAATILLKPDKTELKANGQDLVFLEISMVDQHDNPVHNANNRVEVTVTGQGRLIGLDNGDSTDFDEYKGTSRRLFSGKLLAVIAATTTEGPIHVEVSSKDLPLACLELTSTKAPYPIGLSAMMKNQTSPHKEEVPIRKLEIISPNGTHLYETMPTIEAYVKIHPANATYRDIEWKITNESGIVSNLATLSSNGERVTVHALGDGKASLRCTCKNGNQKVDLISQLEFFFTGLGEATVNPYEFVYAGLYTKSNCELTNGIEHGITTIQDSDSYIGFEHVDFGSYGSDEITIPVYSLDYEPKTILIYEGMPDEEGSELLASVIYDNQPIWNQYQPVTYRLKRRVKGVTTICLVLNERYSIQGFQFTKLEKGFAKLSAKECDSIYGDTFTLTSDAIVGIGNNVALEYRDMDFGINGIHRLKIYGHSPIERNTIHVKFSSLEGDVLQLAEFLYSKDYEERCFTMPHITGMQTVTILFLPGSNFDLKWIQFE